MSFKSGVKGWGNDRYGESEGGSCDEVTVQDKMKKKLVNQKESEQDEVDAVDGSNQVNTLISS